MTQTLTFRAVLTPAGLESDRRIEIGSDGTIRSVGPGRPPYDGFLAIPGMPNAHSHVFQRALAGFGEAARGEDSFWSWREAMYRLAGSITPDQLYAVARYAYAEMLRGGFTHVVEFHYLHHGVGGERGPETTDAVLAAAASVGLPIGLLPVYYRTSGFDGAPATTRQRRFAHDSVEEFLYAVEGCGDRVAGLAPHSLRAAPPEDLPELVAGADAILGRAAPLHIHVSEQEREVAECRERFGRTPIDLLAETVELGPRWNLIHATHATPAERERVRESGAGIVLCPLTEAYLGDGVFEAREHFSAGGRAGIGSDANTRLSAIEEVRQLEYGQRLRDRRRARIATDRGVGEAAWAWLARGGGDAATTGEGSACEASAGEGVVAEGVAAGVRIGRIEVGCRADLVVLDPDGPSLLGHGPESALDAWLVGGDGRDIEAVYVAGERRVSHGAVTDEEEIQAGFAAAMRGLWSS